MAWNWKKSDWPNCSMGSFSAVHAEEQFLIGAGIAVGTVTHLAETEHTITGASPATTTRDLADLTKKKSHVRTGEHKHARYALNLIGGRNSMYSKSGHPAGGH